MKKNLRKKSWSVLIGIIIILILLIILFIYFILTKKDTIYGIRRVLKNRYDSIECVDSACNGFIVKDKNKITLLNKYGKKVSDINNTDSINVYRINKNNYLVKKDKYYLYDDKNKEIYSNDNYIDIINDDYYIFEYDNKYSIVYKDGTIKYDNISKFGSYLDNSLYSLLINNQYTLFDDKFDVILSDYSISQEVNNKYIIVKNEKNNTFNYFDINKLKIIGDSFEKYNINSNNECIITKSENNSLNQYKLDSKGHQISLGSNFNQLSEINSIKDKLDHNSYHLYSESIFESNQKNILVDNLKNKSIGIYNIDTKKYELLYSYKKDVENIYSSINILNNEGELYLQITCSSLCEKQMNIVYNMTKNKKEFDLSTIDAIAQKYIQYENGYKLIKYSQTSNDESYRNKYVLYDDNNKKLAISDNYIYVLGSNILFGDIEYENISFYMVKENKILNQEGSGIIINKNDKKYYKYNDENNVIVLDSDLKEVLNTDLNSYLDYSDNLITYAKSNYVYFYNTKSSMNNSYKLVGNEKIKYSNNENIPSYNGAIFINNYDENYFKIVNFQGKVIEKRKNMIISSVVKNNEKVFIITKDDKNNYGMYVTK
ncbi:MAG: hypothetical protein J6J17_02650 [Bacilli bacterium]|nr:hypothetical protein [Bacilli bacterium]